MTDDEPTTDRHDESDTTQFGDDPTAIDGTPFIPSACIDCRTYVVQTPGYTQPRCIECARTKAGITWPSGQPIGHWHPTVGNPGQTP